MENICLKKVALIRSRTRRERGKERVERKGWKEGELKAFA